MLTAQVENFPPDFEKSAKTNIPLLSTYTSLPDQEKKLIDLLFEENRLFKMVSGSLAYIMASLISYDADQEALTFIITPQTGPMTNEKEKTGEPRKESIGELEERLNKEYGLLGNIYPEYKNWKFSDAYELVKIGKSLNKLKRTIPESRYSEIVDISKNYAELLSAHKHIEEH